MMSATYSPEDNKLRLYSSERLDKATYDRVKAAGFKWAPAQSLFVAPMWTPEREDLLEELTGQEVGDEDTTLTERQEERAERFEGYSERRAADADRAHAAVASIADNIPLGQPILVGHHSERHARRDAEKIQNGMARAVKMWETSKYWEQRAAGALFHAKYKELPAVRYRRIKGLEADLRKVQRDDEKRELCRKIWEKCQTLEQARLICASTEGGWLPCCKHPTLNQYLHPSDVLPFESRSDYAKEHYPTWTLEQVKERAAEVYKVPGPDSRSSRWIAHLTNRLTYERAMLEESGGIAGAKFDYQPGGKVLDRRGKWLPVVKVNKRGGVVVSVGVVGHWALSISLDEIRDYQPPAEGDAEKAKAIMDKGPMCNYPGEGFKHMTYAEWKRNQWSDCSYSEIIAENEQHGRHRIRCKPAGLMKRDRVYLTDRPRKDPPKPTGKPRPTFETKTEPQEPRTPRPAVEPNKFERMKESLAAGVQVVSAPQLFPTPPAIARDLVSLAGLWDGCEVLEPSAGTGNLLRAIFDSGTIPGRVSAVEVSPSLCQTLRGFASVSLAPVDFLSCVVGDTPTANNDSAVALGRFDRVIMNPPFENGADIKHMRHALQFLKPGGRVVAICANGPRQQAAFKDIAEHWQDLEPGSFKESGTNVNAAIVVLSAP